jgi:glycosyltransferase involved in cell wall biosynthesis
MTSLDLSIVIPCYQEEPHLKESIRILTAALEQTKYAYEIILVDDVSPDGTRGAIEDICKDHPRARYIFHDKNKGRGGAFKTGFREAKGRIAGFLDIDLEVGAHYVAPMLRLIDEEGFDIATGHRYYLMSQTGGWIRHILSHGYRWMCGFFLNFGIKDSETGFKFFNVETCRKAILHSESDGWFWDTEVMVRASLANLKIKEFPVLFLRRFDKASTVRIIPDTLAYLRELYSFRKKIGLGMADRSPIYWTGRGYDFVMQILCGKTNQETLAAVAGHIPENASVVDLCCGTAMLYRTQLKAKNCKYLGLDANGHFVMSIRRRAISSQLHNTAKDPIPEADYIVMCNSFYHFHDKADELLEKMRAAAKKAVILTEPVRNMSTGGFGPLARFSNWLTNPGVGDYTQRFTPESFRAFCEKNNAASYDHKDGQRNAVAVFKTPDQT